MDIRVFPSTAETFDGGVPLMPSSAIVTEEANGNYSLEIVQFRDDQYGRHKLLQNGSVIVCDVPSKCLPIRHVETTTGIVERYQASGTPRQTTDNVLNVPENIFKAQIDGYLRTHPKATHTDAYNALIELYSDKKTRYTYDDVPCYKSDDLKEVVTMVTTGRSLNAIRTGEGWVFGITSTGLTGYFKRSDLYYVGRVEGDVWSVVDDDQSVATRQPFRITKVRKQDGKQMTVTAQHIYFDAIAEELPKREFSNEPLENVCEYLNQNGHITYHAGAVRYITEDAEGNAVHVASDICENYNLQLVRDGYDAYFLEAGSSERAIYITTGVNAKKLTIDTDTRSLYTRWIPIVDEVEQEPIDSEHINDYPLIYSKRVSGKTEQECKKIIDEDLENHVDLPKISVNAECIQGSIDAVSVFDAAIIHDGLFGDDLTAQINSITFDVLTGHIKSVKMGESKMRFTANVFAPVKGSWQTIR